MTLCEVGEEVPQRLGGLLHQIEGSPAQITRLMRGRDGTPTVDVEALLRL